MACLALRSAPWQGEACQASLQPTHGGGQRARMSRRPGAPGRRPSPGVSMGAGKAGASSSPPAIPIVASTWTTAVIRRRERSPPGPERSSSRCRATPRPVRLAGGLHILVRAAMPGHIGRKQGAVEVYDAERYFALTGERLVGAPATLEGRQAETLALYATLAREEPEMLPAAARPRPTLSHSDAEVLRRALASASGATFQALWSGTCTPRPTPAPASPIRAALTSPCVCCSPTGATAIRTR